MWLFRRKVSNRPTKLNRTSIWGTQAVMHEWGQHMFLYRNTALALPWGLDNQTRYWDVMREERERERRVCLRSDHIKSSWSKNKEEEEEEESGRKTGMNGMKQVSRQPRVAWLISFKSDVQHLTQMKYIFNQCLSRENWPSMDACPSASFTNRFSPLVSFSITFLFIHPPMLVLLLVHPVHVCVWTFECLMQTA